MRAWKLSNRSVTMARRAICVLFVGLQAPAHVACTAQVPSASQSSPMDGASGSRRSVLGADSMDPKDPLGPSNALRLQKLREDERHKRLVADTAKLLALTNELKAEVEKASKDELSLDVVRKAAEIEKLARDVRERMKS